MYETKKDVSTSFCACAASSVSVIDISHVRSMITCKYPLLYTLLFKACCRDREQNFVH